MTAGAIAEQRDFRLFLVGRFVAALALQMQSVAIGWYLYDHTGDPMVLAYAGLSVFLPIALLTLPAGDIADRVDRRTIVGTAHVVLAVGAGVLFVLAATRTTQNWPFYAVLAGTGAARAFYGPALPSLLAQIMPRERLPSAVAWSSSASQTATVLGPAVGGFVYLLGPQAPFATCLVLSLVAAAASFSIRSRRVSVDETRGSAVARVLQGLRYLKRQPILLGAISLDLFAVLLGSITAVLPIFARDVLNVGPEGLGALRSSLAAGAVAAGVFLARLPPARQPHAGAALFVGVGLFGAAALLFGVSQSFVLSAVALAVMGAGDMMSVFVRATVVQLGTPDGMRGRVSSVHALFVGAANELGDFRAAAMAAWLGAVPAVLAGGFCTLGVVLVWSLAFPQLRRVQRLADVQSRL